MTHHRWAYFALCAAFLLLGLLSGCGGGGSVVSRPVSSAPRTFNNLQLTLTADKTACKVLQPINFTLVVKNIGTQSISYEGGSFFDGDADVVQNGKIVWHYPGPFGGTGGGVYTAMLQPGDTTTFPFTWYASGPGLFTLNAWFNPGRLNGVDVSAQQAQTSLTAAPIQVKVQAQ